MRRVLLFSFVISCILPVQSAVADVVINEIMYNPSSNDLDAEYIELFNTHNSKVDLSGWRFKSGIDFVFPAGTEIGAEDFLVVCRNEIFVRAFYQLNASIHTVGNYAPTKLSNTGEEIRLFDALGNEVDRVEYSDIAPWPLIADGDGASLELVHPSIDNNNVLYWQASPVPSPGLPNRNRVSSLPPQILDIKRIPQSPTNTDRVRIEVFLAQNPSLLTASLSYTVGGQSHLLPMIQQGHLYTAEIPPQAIGTLVRYSLTVSNAEGFQITVPLGVGQDRFTYKVNNNPVAVGSVLITEIMYGSSSIDDEENEWFELFNPTAQTIDLSDWVVKDSNDLHIFSLPPGTQLPANGYLVVQKKPIPGMKVPAISGFPFSLNNQGDAIRLFDPNGRLITHVEYNDNSEWPAPPTDFAATLELLQTTRPNHEANNWAYSSGSPGRANQRAIDDPGYNDFSVVINEIFYHPEEEEYDNNLDKEYVELFNTSNQPVDLSQWFFSDGIEFIFPAGTSIPANEYLLVCRNVDSYPDISNKIGNFILQLNNAGEALALTNDEGVVIDYVRYNDKSPWPNRPDGDGYSLELIVPGGDNRDAFSWRSGQPSSPGKPNAALFPNEPPRITQVKHTPRVPTASTSEQRTEEKLLVDTGETWKYFKGTQAPPSNWNTVEFDDSSWQQGQAGFGYGDGDDQTEFKDMRNNFVSVFIRNSFTLQDVEGFATLVLGIDYDDSFIAYLNGVEIARSNVSGNPPNFNATADGNHEAGTMEGFDVSSFIKNLRVGKNVLSVEGHNVSRTSSDFSLHPALAMLRVLDAGEDASDDVVITAKAFDRDGIERVTLHYQRLSAPFGTGLVLDEWKTAPMFDNGTDGDLLAGDGIYTAILNHSVTLHPREIYRYKISAVDTTGQESVIPRPEEKTQTKALFVEDSLTHPAYPTIYLFAEREVLSWLNRNVDSDDEQPSMVVIDGDVYDLMNAGGIRFRGHVLRNKPKKSWKIRFAKDNRWMNRRAYNLNANFQTSPLLRGESGFQEYLAYQFMRQAGVPAADTQHYRVMLNNEYYGLFIGIEQYNEDFLDAHNMAEETRIFKAGIKARRSYLTKEPNFDAYAQKYESSTGRDEDIQPLIDFIESLNDATDLKTFFESNLDIETYLNYITAVAVLSHVDSTEKNYFPTRGVDGRWFIMPWDMSHAWGEIHTNDKFPLISDYSLLDGAQGGVFGTNRLRQKFLSVPEFRDRYYQRLRYFVDHIFTHEHLDALFDGYWKFLQDAIRENVVRWNSPGKIDDMVAEMKKYITARRAFILSDKNVRPDRIPAMPANLSPADGSPVTKRNVLLQAAVPADQTAMLMEWEIQQDHTDFYKPVWVGRHEPGTPSIEVPAFVVGSGTTYYWRVRYKNAEGLWSDWSLPTSFKANDNLPVPNVENVVVTPMNESVRIEWNVPVASDLIRVDIFQDNKIVESTPIHDNRVRIRDLVNGQFYTFVIRTVSSDLRMSNGVIVNARPIGPITEGNVIAYFRFEGDTTESVGLFPEGRLVGAATIQEPGANEQVPLTEATNTSSLALNGIEGNGFLFGSTEPFLDIETSMTLECWAMLSLNSITPAVLIDRYDESKASIDGVWRFGIGLSNFGSIDFFFNDADTSSGFNGRFHVASHAGIAPIDGLFHHYAAVVDLQENSAAAKVRLYLDGHLVPSSILHDDGVSDYDRLRTGSDIPVMIGARRTATGTTDVVPGRVDEVRISAGILEPSQFLIGPAITVIHDWALY